MTSVKTEAKVNKDILMVFGLVNHVEPFGGIICTVTHRHASARKIAQGADLKNALAWACINQKTSQA